MSDWIEEEARRLGAGAREGGAAGEAAAAAGATPDLWGGLRERVRADVRRINEKLGPRLGGELRFVEPGEGAFEVRRTGGQAVSLRVTRVEGFLVVKYTRTGDAATHRTEEFRRMEVVPDEQGGARLKSREGQFLGFEEASQHLLRPLIG